MMSLFDSTCRHCERTLRSNLLVVLRIASGTPALAGGVWEEQERLAMTLLKGSGIYV